MKKQIVYIVEDSEIIRDMVVWLFRNKSDLIVKSFSSGEELLENIKGETPNLLLLDYYLNTENKKALNGFEILKILRGKLEGTAVIILSGITDEIKINQFREFGIVDFISKDSDDIFTKIESASLKYLVN